MNCSYHNHNAAVVNCNGCGRSLCSGCDHRIKGFPFCQDCIVAGIQMLRDDRSRPASAGAKRRTSPFIATVLSLFCPGLGAAYNAQTTKALIHFAVFAGLLQMAFLTSGMPLFVLGFIGMWLFSAVDAFRTARLIRSGVNVDGAEDILVRRFSNNPKAWGVVLTLLGISFFLQAFLDFRFLMRGILPILLIGLGLYLIRDFFMRPGKSLANSVDFDSRTGQPLFINGLGEEDFRSSSFDADSDYETQIRVKNWKSR
ncbi:MAG: hypothetical protein KIS76_06360 [Pyrinomonadaceae bacterium]|nr:hypothetical protein [Pyrinomonadaceae bacterium]